MRSLLLYNKLPKRVQLKTTSIYYLPVSVALESTSSIAGEVLAQGLSWLQGRRQPGLQSSECFLGLQDKLPASLMWLLAGHRSSLAVS